MLAKGPFLCKLANPNPCGPIGRLGGVKSTMISSTSSSSSELAILIGCSASCPSSSELEDRISIVVRNLFRESFGIFLLEDDGDGAWRFCLGGGVARNSSGMENVLSLTLVVFPFTSALEMVESLGAACTKHSYAGSSL